MLEKTKKFVSDHKSQIITAAVSAVVGGAVVYFYYDRKTLLNVPDDLIEKLMEKPQERWAGYYLPNVILAMTAVKPEVH